MDRFTGVTHALLRIVAGLLLFQPGALKIFGWYGGMPEGVRMTPLITTGGWMEIVFGTLIMLGLFTRPAAFLASGEMAVAYFNGHFMKGGFWPVENGGSPAVLLCFIFLFLSTAGAGPLSLDEVLRGRRGGGRARGRR